VGRTLAVGTVGGAVYAYKKGYCTKEKLLIVKNAILKLFGKEPEKDESGTSKESQNDESGTSMSKKDESGTSMSKKDESGTSKSKKDEPGTNSRALDEPEKSGCWAMKVTAGGAAALAVTGFALCYACPSVGYMTYIKLLMCVGLPSYVGYIAAPILVGLGYMYLPWTKWIPGWGYCCKQDTSNGDNAPPEGALADNNSSAAESKGDGFLANLWKRIQTYVICGVGLVVGGGVLYYWYGTGEGQSSSCNGFLRSGVCYSSDPDKGSSGPSWKSGWSSSGPSWERKERGGKSKKTAEDAANSINPKYPSMDRCLYNHLPKEYTKNFDQLQLARARNATTPKKAYRHYALLAHPDKAPAGIKQKATAAFECVEQAKQNLV